MFNTGHPVVTIMEEGRYPTILQDLIGAHCIIPVTTVNTMIGGSAFEYCKSLTSVIIPASVTEIGRSAFSSDSLTDIYYGGTAEQWKAIGGSSAISIFSNCKVHYESTN